MVGTFEVEFINANVMVTVIYITTVYSTIGLPVRSSTKHENIAPPVKINQSQFQV